MGLGRASLPGGSERLAAITARTAFIPTLVAAPPLPLSSPSSENPKTRELI
jgi:hypothetical protein